MRIDLLYHYIGGELLGKLCELYGLNTVDNGVVSGAIMVGKELTDATGFDVLDLVAGIAGWVVTVL